MKENKIEGIRKRLYMRRKNGGVIQTDDAEGGWITINGTHVPVSKGGALQGSIGSKISGNSGKNQKGNSGSGSRLKGKEGVSQLKSIVKAKTTFGPAHNDKEFYDKVQKTLDEIEPGTNIECRTTGEGEKLYHKNDDGTFDVYKYSDINGKYGFLRTQKKVSSSSTAALIGWEETIYDYDPKTKV